MIPQETIEEIRARCNIVELVGSYLPQLRRRGATFKCNCPFHQEKTPSFTVNEARQIFHCFGCGAGGDVFRFVMDYEKVDFVSAVRMLAERVGVEVVLTGGSPEKTAEKDVLFRLHREAAVFYHRMLTDGPEGAEARRYLEERELPAEVLQQFQIGFAPNEWDGLMKRALKKGYSTEQLEAAGLVVASERAGKNSHYDRFRNRVMFPICDQQGRVIGFSGRIINSAEKGAKYVNSPETLLFRKNQTLFALDKARKAIVEKRQAIVVEGQIDAIRCHQAGLTHVVASQGTALTEQHARLIGRYADEVVLVLDSDSAGIKAALSSSETFIAAELSVRVVTLPDNEDPDSLVRQQGAEKLQQLVDEAPDAIDFLMGCLWGRENMQTEAGRMRVAKAAMGLINSSPSPIRRDQMIQAVTALGLNYRAVAGDLQRERRKARPASRRESAEPVAAPRPEHFPPDEIGLLELLVHHYPEVQPLVHDYLPAACITHPVCRELVELLMVDPPESLHDGFSEFDEATQRLITRVQVEETRAIDTETTAADLTKIYIQRFWKRVIEQKKTASRQQTDLSDEEQFTLSSRIRKELLALSGTWEEALPVLTQQLHPTETTDGE